MRGLFGFGLMVKGMRPTRLCATFLICMVFLSVACEQVNNLTSTKIKDIRERPRQYENKEITVYGTVIDVVSLVVVKYFELQDDTGSIKVVTDKLLPAKGEKLRVTGRMTAIEIGTERWIVLRERTNLPREE